VADPDVDAAMARSFLGTLPADLVDELLAAGERTDYPEGTTIYREGSPPRAALVIEGLLRVYMTSAEGRQVTVRRVAWAVAEELNRRLYDTLQQTAVNAFGSVRQRVAAQLLDLASAQQRPEGRLVAQVSQRELADAVGSVREVVARVLREFRLAGLVATAPDSVLILDAARLHRESWSPVAT
jgi:CRP/FNR family cyclic AMP-dependent transcriptional regulator